MICMYFAEGHYSYLNLHEVSSLQIKKKTETYSILNIFLSEQCRRLAKKKQQKNKKKTDGLIIF